LICSYNHLPFLSTFCPATLGSDQNPLLAGRFDAQNKYSVRCVSYFPTISLILCEVIIHHIVFSCNKKKPIKIAGCVQIFWQAILAFEEIGPFDCPFGYAQGFG